MNAPVVQKVAQRLEKGELLSLTGLDLHAQAFFAAVLQRLCSGRSVVAVLSQRREQEIFEQNLRTWLQLLDPSQPEQNSRTLFFPDWEVLPHETKLPHADVISERLETLTALASDQRRSVVTNVIALLQLTFNPDALKKRTRRFSKGDQMDPLDLVEWLEDQGYEPESQVTEKGDLSLRGGILDCFPLTSPWPVRLEFFGNELDSLRLFNPATQISMETVKSVTIPPAGELGILRRSVKEGGLTAHGMLADHLPPDTLWLLAEPDALHERAEDYTAHLKEADPLLAQWSEFQQDLSAKGHTLVRMTADDAEQQTAINPGFVSLDVYRPTTDKAPTREVKEIQQATFLEQMNRWLRQGFQVHVLCNNEGEQERFEEVWRSTPFYEPKAAAPTIQIGSLSGGFVWDAAKLVVVTDAEVFGRTKFQRPRRLKAAHAQTTRSALDIDFTDLEEDDLVVHIQYGIGRYIGLAPMPAGVSRHSSPERNSGQECLVLEYAATDPTQTLPKLYVPVSEAHLVSKYVGAGKAHPPLNTLSGTRWKKAKKQAEEAVHDIAAEMLTIQAARDSQPGHAFEIDTHWQQEFEQSFVFEETPDQSRAIQETKADLELSRPMDRLICGDVGFGKTEVAIRAAFKAVMGGKQVALLVPTTVLAQQHFNTFSDRMADYPIRVELLSRFRSRRQQQEVVRDLALGAVDIVIGTHRLVQSDIVFKDLGLVVVDEEQRFGVLHKERLKQLRMTVDVLTLSATPIPRTLYLAICGARDMSTIQTPPQDRLPVETIVSPYDERLIRDAIQRELNRGGQVFFLHNRVKTIQTMARKLENLVPHARILVGHGQMDADELETVMNRFVNGEADILLSTTIIESGLDIPNANTIIIDRADRFGLSDLYQLRGRVGRYKHQAYAHLLIPRHAGLLTEARKRISAIRQYSTLGSGFKIAMRDLEIRGAGNLLGSEQSGHITAVGFDLYCQLLKQSVSTLKGETVKPRVTVEVNLDFLTVGTDLSETQQSASSRKTQDATAALPYSYIADSRQRITLYRKLAECDDRASVKALEAELTDRFGEPPRSVKHLLTLIDLKVMAAARNVTRIESDEDKLMLTRNGDFIQTGGRFPRLTGKSTSARLKEIRRLLMAL